MNIDLLVPLFAAAVVSGTPLLYATLGELCTEKTGVLNLGVEGVMLVGCLAAFVTARLTGSPWLAFVAAGLAGGLFASLHAEVDKDDDISAIHDIIDTVERQIYHELGCEICIHMDPIAVGDKKTAECRIMAANLLAEIDPKLTMHDFRITSGPDHTNLIFDVVRPLDCKYTSEELQQRIQTAVSALPGRYFAVITVDTPRI